MRACSTLVILVAISLCSATKELSGNIDGVYTVSKNHHYANKSTLIWGENDQFSMTVQVSFAPSCATYNSSSSCDDPAWYAVRCGYLHSNHQDSDRFVWRRCTTENCDGFNDSSSPRVQLAAYSYDAGIPPYTGENPQLLQVFSSLLIPETIYALGLSMSGNGDSMFKLRDENGSINEVIIVKHSNLCPDNYNEGMVQGLYFGGSCRAPQDVTVEYFSS